MKKYLMMALWLSGCGAPATGDKCAARCGYYALTVSSAGDACRISGGDYVLPIDEGSPASLSYLVCPGADTIPTDDGTCSISVEERCSLHADDGRRLSVWIATGDISWSPDGSIGQGSWLLKIMDDEVVI